MPNMSQVFQSSERKVHRYRVIATDETGSAVSENGSRNVVRLATIGPKMNIQLIDLCDDRTGEVRTYLADSLEELPQEK